jgi:hypothetical protein
VIEELDFVTVLLLVPKEETVDMYVSQHQDSTLSSIDPANFMRPEHSVPRTQLKSKVFLVD